MFPRECFWAAVFGAIGGVITVFCLNALSLKTAGEAEAREAEARKQRLAKQRLAKQRLEKQRLEKQRFSMQDLRIIPKNMMSDLAKKK